MGELLSAAALITTVIAILFSLWYPEIEAAMAIKAANRPPFRADRLPEIAHARQTLLTKCMPLSVIAAMPALVFAPEALGVLVRSIDALADPLSRYDAVAAAFVAVYLLTLVLLVISVAQARRMTRWWRSWDASDDR